MLLDRKGYAVREDTLHQLLTVYQFLGLRNSKLTVPRAGGYQINDRQMQVYFLFVILHFIPETLWCYCVFLKVSVRVFFYLGELIKLFKKLLVFIHAQVFSEFIIGDNLLQNDLLVNVFIPLIKVYLSFKFWVFGRVKDLLLDGSQFDKLSEKDALELFVINNFVYQKFDEVLTVFRVAIALHDFRDKHSRVNVFVQHF